MSLKRDLALVSSQPHTFHLFKYWYVFSLSLLLTWGCYIVFVQITQEVFVAKKWVKEARNDAKNEVHLCFETEKALRATKEEN